MISTLPKETLLLRWLLDVMVGVSILEPQQNLFQEERIWRGAKSDRCSINMTTSQAARETQDCK
jgi:hypothetical protein